MVGKVEDYTHLFQKKQEPEEPSALSRFDKEIIGGAAVRLEIPVADAKFHELDQIADILIGAGNAIKFQVNRNRQKNGPTEKEIKYSIRAFLLDARRTIRQVTAGLWNRNGTVKG